MKRNSHDVAVSLERLPNEVRVCNCTSCQRLLIGRRYYAIYGLPAGATLNDVAVSSATNKDKPMCKDCRGTQGVLQRS